MKLLYVAPERFNNERFLAMLERLKIALFAVDEAHCISEWGHNFRPDYLKLAEVRQQIRAERVLGLTATATPQVVRDICAAFQIPAAAAIVTGFYRPNLTLLTTPAPPVMPPRRPKLPSRPLGPAGQSADHPWHHAVPDHYAYHQFAKDRRAWERGQP